MNLIGRSQAERDWQFQFIEQLTPESRANFQFHIDQKTQCLNYRFSPAPIAIEKKRYQRLEKATEAAMALMLSPEYQNKVADRPWLLPQRPITKNDLCGSVDFLIGENEEKIIEVNPIPPGFVGYLELIDQARIHAYGAMPSPTNLGFEKAFTDWISDKGKHHQILVAVNHTIASQAYLPHYRYIIETLRKHDIDADMVFANELDTTTTTNGINWKGKNYSRIFNLVIPKIIERHPEEFSNYIKLYHDEPDLIFPNPFCWQLGNKSILHTFTHIHQQPYGLSALQQTALLRASLETYPLQSFDTATDLLQQFGGTEQIVVKPLDDYNRSGLIIQPTLKQLEERIQEDTASSMVQQYYQHPTTLSVTPQNRPIKQQFTTRMGYLNGKVFGLRGASWHYLTFGSWLASFVVI